MPHIMITVVLDYLEAAHGELALCFVSEQQPIAHVFKQRPGFIREEIKDPFLYDHVLAKAGTAHPTHSSRLVMAISDKTSYVFSSYRQMKHKEVVVFLSLTEAAVVIRFSEADVTLHLFREGDAGL